MQPVSANEVSHAGIDTQVVQYVLPPQLGPGHVIVPFAYSYRINRTSRISTGQKYKIGFAFNEAKIYHWLKEKGDPKRSGI